MSKAQSKNPRKPKTKKTQSRPLAAQVAQAVGGALGSLVGMKDAGRDAGSWLANVTGLGDYKVSQNSFMKSSASVPQFEYNADGSIIVTHREFVREIVGSTTFNTQTFDVCPTVDNAFPWLRIIAQAYEQYEFLGLLACYVPTSGSAIASTNNALGSVIMATEYDVSRPVFASKAEMEQSMFVTSDKPSEHQIHPIECNPKRDTINARYLDGPFRASAAPVGAVSASAQIADVERNLRCTGRLQVSTSGMQAAVTVGDLWWAIKVKFSKPRGLPPGALGGYFKASSGALSLATGDSTFRYQNIWNFSTSGANSIGFPVGTTNTLTFDGLRPGTVVEIIYYALRTAGAGVFSGGSLTPTSLTPLADMNPNASGASYTYTFTDANQYVQRLSYVVDETAYTAPPKIVYGNPGITGGSTWSWDLEVHVRPRLNLVPSVALTAGINTQVEQLQQQINALTTALHEDEEKYVSSPNPVPQRRLFGL